MAFVKYLPETLFSPLPFVLCSLHFLCMAQPSQSASQACSLSLSLSLSLSSAHLSNLSWNTPGKLPLIGCHLGLLAPSVDIQLPELFPGFHITCRISIEFNLPSLDSQDAFFLFREWEFALCKIFHSGCKLSYDSSRLSCYSKVCLPYHCSLRRNNEALCLPQSFSETLHTWPLFIRAKNVIR